MQVDVGFGDALVPGPSPIFYPGPLDLPPAEILGYSLESALAEKLQVMAVLGELNSRLKDYYDIWLALRHMRIDGEQLRQAIRSTFLRRGTPMAWPEASLGLGYAHAHQAQWAVLVRRLGEPATPSLEVTIREIDRFLGPVTDAAGRGRPFAGAEPPGGPWQ